MQMAPCGIDCNNCDLQPEQCDGCHTRSDHQWCGDCAMRVCCIFERGLDHCAQCDDFPCAHIAAFDADRWPHHSAAVAHLRALREAEGARP